MGRKPSRLEDESSEMETSNIAVLRQVLSEHSKKSITDSSLMPAGVMILLYQKEGEYCVLLNKRSNEVEHHKGEISFPGGAKDHADHTLLDTALRETNEEMGIAPEDVTVLGEVDDIITGTQFLICPFVGAIPSNYAILPFAKEVAEVLEVPISSLMNKKNSRDEVRIFDGELDYAPSYVYNGNVIFGATARILNQLLELLDSVPNKEAQWKTNQR